MVRKNKTKCKNVRAILLKPCSIKIIEMASSEEKKTIKAPMTEYFSMLALSAQTGRR